MSGERSRNQAGKGACVLSLTVWGFLSAAGCSPGERSFSDGGGSAGTGQGGHAAGNNVTAGVGGQAASGGKSPTGGNGTGGLDGQIAGTNAGDAGDAGDGGTGETAGSAGVGGHAGGGGGAGGGNGLKSNGEMCSADADCASEHCADEVCCDTACMGQCESCSSSASPGTCVAAQMPRTPCTGTGVCGGQCNGTNRTSCVYPGDETTCAAASCTNGMARSAASCSGSGACSSATSMTCPFGCQSGGTTCSQCRQKSSSNLLLNPGFDENAASWTIDGGAAWQPLTDAENCSASGSILLDNIVHEIEQCRPANGDTLYYFGYLFKGAGSSPSTYCGWAFYAETGCSGSADPESQQTIAADGNTTSWMEISTTLRSPADARSVGVWCVGFGGFGYYDQFYLSATNATY